MSKKDGKKADEKKQERRRGTSPNPRSSLAARASSRTTVATEGTAATPVDVGISVLGMRQEPWAAVVTEKPHVEHAEAPVGGSVPGEQGPACASSKNIVSSDGTVSKPADTGAIIIKVRPEPCTVPFTQKLLDEPAGVPVTGSPPGDRDPVRASSRTTVSSDSATVKPANAITLNITAEPCLAAFTAKSQAEPRVAPAAAAVPGEQEPGPLSSMTTVASDGAPGKPVDIGATALEILQEQCAPAVTDEPQYEPPQSRAAGTVPEQEQHQDPGEGVQLAPTPSTAVKQDESPVAATANIRPEVPITKTTGKRGQSDKRRNQRRRGTARDSTAKSPQVTTSPKSVASPQAYEGLPATSAATSGATSPATSSAASPATGAVPNATASIRQEVLKEGVARKHGDESAVEPALPPSDTTATRELQGPSKAVQTGATTGERPTGQADYKMSAGAPSGPSMNVGQSPLQRGGRPNPADVDKDRKQATADLLASIANLQSNLETVRTPELQSTKTSELFKRGKCSQAKTQIWITVALFGACISLLLFMVLLSGILRQPTINRALCLTEDCARHAALLTKYLNRTLDPCEDYAAFVCSAWEPAKTHIELARSAIDDLRFTWYKHFMDTLASGSLKISAGRKPLAMYDMCLKKFPYNASQMALIRDILHSQGLSWPEQPPKLQQPLTMFVAFSYKWLMSFWITVYVRHPRPSGRRHVFVSPGLYIPILLNHHRSVAQSYARYWQQFLLLFYPDLVDRPPMDENHINRIRIMEEYILTRLYQEVKSPRKKPALFSFKDIGSHLRNASTAEWVRDFQAGLLLQPELTADDQIIVTDIAFLATVTKLLDTYSTKQLNMHVSWLIMQYLTIAGDYSVLVRYYGSLETADKLLPIYCSHHVEVVFKVLISALGFFSRFTARDREAIDTGFNSLVSAAVDRINHSSWLDNESKIRARKKLSSVRAAIWPPTSLLNNETLEKIYANFPEKEPSYAHYWLSGRKAANTVNMTQGYDEALMLLGNHFPVYADYNYVYNVVKLAMATASPPAFYRNGTKGMLYGGLLFIMAMQLARAIDGEGIQWSANRTADENTILSSFSLQEFHAREKCQHGEGNSSVFPEVPAVEIAYAALTASLRDADWLIDIAPDLPEKKVFFMTLCYMTCASPGARNAISADCNKVVRNSDAFAEVYGCPKGSNMNPVKKCSFFS